MRSLLSITLLCAALSSGCAAVLVGGAAVLISQDTIEDSVFVLQVSTNVDQTWASVKNTVSHSSLKPTNDDNELRKIEADIDGSKVTVQVEAYDLDKSMVKVSARKYGIADGTTAAMIKDKILADLEHKH